jgi:hypothetical protein
MTNQEIVQLLIKEKFHPKDFDSLTFLYIEEMKLQGFKLIEDYMFQEKITRQQVYNRIKNGLIKKIKIGQTVLIEEPTVTFKSDLNY